MENFKVKCVYSSSDFFNQGETYEVKNGFLFLSNGITQYSNMKKYNTVVEINNDMKKLNQRTYFRLVNEYPEHILKILRQRRGLDENDKTEDKDLNMLSQNEVFSEVCEWDGLCGYAYKIKIWIDDIYKIDIESITE